MYRYSRLFAATAALSVLVSASVSAEEDRPAIEEIVVTAEFRDLSVLDYAGSATVIQPNAEGSVVNHLEEVLGRAPNVNFSSGASRARFIQIRGIGERGQFDEPLNSSVGLIVDGVDLSGIGTAATLYDVQQVEVLRGPQGTLYGANALAGLINIVTPPPSDAHIGNVRLDAGDYGAFGLGAVVSGPLTDKLGYRIAAQHYRDDGFIENDFLNRDDTDNHDETTFRAKFVYSGDRTDWTLALGRVDVESGYDAFSLDNNRTTRSDEPGFDEQQTDYVAISLDHQLSEDVTFQASIGVAESDIDYGYDEDWTFSGFDPIGYTSTDRYSRSRETTTLEARLLSAPDSGLFGSDWSWVVGTFLLRQETDLTRTYTFLGGPFNSEFQIERLAVYGELSNEIADGWHLTLGGRVERHLSEYDDSFGVALDPEDDLFGGRILLERELSDSSFLYVGVTQGYKSGGFNADGSLDADLREFDEETLWNFEVGYKASFEKLNLRAAVFRMQRDDIQIATSITRPILGGGGAVQFIQFTSNAAEGFNQGIELELDYYASDSLTLFANVGLLDTEYDDFVDANGDDQGGREQAQAPGYQFFAGANYQISDRWSFQVELEGRDEYFFSDSHQIKSDAYELINASVTYARDNWRIRAWGRNLSDEDYFVRGFFFGNDPRDFYTARGFTQLGEPRQYGVTIETTF
ncbi:MAG: TonB-dependent receptor [Pseudomonadota bacterium]